MRRTVVVPVVLAVAGVLAACAGDESDSAATTADSAATTSGAVTSSGEGSQSDSTADAVADASRAQCLVRLHGKGGTGGEPVTDGETTTISPTGNADGWGARQWLYFPDDRYEEARDVVADAVEGCQKVIVNGFSNGASFATKLYCSGESFDGRLVRVVVDDPVADAGPIGCSPADGVEVTLYWTGALEATAPAGWDCADGDWTCEGGRSIGIDAYAEAVGADIQESPNDEHDWYWDAPEVSQW